LSVVELCREDEIAVVLVDNPPVNALKHEVRLGLMDAFSQALVYPGAEAVSALQEDLPQALAFAARIPGMGQRAVEVRPILDFRT